MHEIYNSLFDSFTGLDNISHKFEQNRRNLSNNGWYAFIDGVTENNVTGWVKRYDTHDPQSIDIYINDKLVAKNILSNAYRKDIEDAGYENGCYSFDYKFSIDDYELPKFFVSITDSITGNLLATRLFDLTNNFSQSKLLQLIDYFSRAKKLIPLIAFSKCFADMNYKIPYPSDIIKLIIASAKQSKVEPIIDYFYSIFNYVHNDDDNYLISPLMTHSWNYKTLLYEAFNRSLQAFSRSQNSLEKQTTYRVLNLLTFMDDNNIYKVLYNNFIEKYIISPKSSHNTNIFTHPICLILDSVYNLQFILPVIKRFPYPLIHLVFIHKTDYDQTLIDRYGLQKYTYFNIRVDLQNYQVFLIDQSIVLRYYEKIKHGLIILYTHSTDDKCYVDINKYDCFIASSRHQISMSLESQLIYKTYVISRYNYKHFEHMNYKDKTEFVHTGPYHIGDMLNSAYSFDRRQMKEQLRSSLPLSYDPHKPLIVCFEDEFTIKKQIIYLINQLSRDCTIIFKPITLYGSKLLKSLNENVLIYSDEYGSLNMFKFAADFTLCGRYSGTFSTCLMLGVRPLVYYSNYVYDCFNSTNIHPRELIFPPAMPKNLDIHSLIDLHWPYMFRVTDLKGIRQAIFENDYSIWFKANIGSLQKNVFGHYFLENAVDKTVEYILRFACEGSLHEDATTIVLKNSSSTFSI